MTLPHPDVLSARCSNQHFLTTLPLSSANGRVAPFRKTLASSTPSLLKCPDWRRSSACQVRCQQIDEAAQSRDAEHLQAGIGRGRIVRAISGTILAPLLHIKWPGRAEAALPDIATPPPGQALMRTLHDSKLAVAIYPTFSYNAVGGGGLASARQDGDIVHLTFDPATLNIPDVNYRNTTFMGVPMAPPFSIAVQPRKLEGFVDRKTGKAELVFLADFLFTAGPLYKAPPLVVTTLLTTESVQGDVQGGTGKRMDEDGFAKLVGVARLDPTHDVLLDRFLMLPNDCLALMSCQFAFNPSTA